MSGFVEWINSVVQHLGYTEIFFLMALESSLFPVPSELVMIPAGYRSAQGGLDPWLATLAGGAVLAAFTLLTTDVIAPAGERAAERIRSEARYGTDPGALVRPVWLRSGDEIYHVRRVEDPENVEAVTVYSIGDDGELVAISDVERASHRDGVWQAEDVRRTRFAGDAVERERIDALEWPSGPSPDVLELVVLESDTLSIRGLLRLIGYLRENGLDTQQYELSLWQKLVSPLTVLVMMLLSMCR